MELFVDILFWIHLISLGVAGAAVFGNPIVGSRMKAAPAEARPVLISILHGLSTLGRGALVALLITGPLMFWLKYGGAAPNVWFWVKMVLVVVLLGVVIYAGINGARAEKGDREAAARGPVIGMAGMAAYLAIMAAAVAAFS
jgi:hypothetical protein